MIGIENFGAFLLAGIILNLTPGADTMYILARSISQGKKAGIYSVLGISSGIILHTFAAAFGLSLIIAQSALAFNIIKYLGAGYLIFLGIKSLTSSKKNQLIRIQHELSGKKIFLSGMLTNVLNPKVALFFLAFLPQFIQLQHSQNPGPYLILGMSFVATATLWTMIIVLLSAKFASFIRHNQHVEQWINRSAGVVFILLGLKVALERSK
ncbi:homoserine/homoserine lactone efflux protein [Fulvivirga imtechensis AK7]|uniref:Homoserine/homoserine lactone efflux protein n=1 Tax=Fulvivirga imtechensis AK7 TaxID=1237149 RepID=L8JQJ6_9BACT|nr:LysE family translocator [Fulvivirga imtechensis]ELR70493.1 homoserine/homoserine lactone efflux protein [Fulvivirga imtechensis AK7]